MNINQVKTQNYLFQMESLISDGIGKWLDSITTS